MEQKPALGARDVRRHWEKSARKHGLSYEASWADRYAIELEVREIAKHLEAGDHVLDAGCGNGFTAMRLASLKNIRLHGVDYVPAMVQNARKRLKGRPVLSKRLRFDRGDITKLAEPTGVYDKVVAVRVFIFARELRALHCGEQQNHDPRARHY